MRFLPLKIAFFEGFENDNILSSKSYTVTKSGISPQRKLGSWRNLKLKLIRYELITKKIFVKIRARTRAYEPESRAQIFCRARVYGSYARVRARIFTKKNLVVKSYLMNLSFKFRKDPSFRWGDILLFVTMYDLELKILSFSKPPKNAILSAKKRTLRFIFFNIFFDNKH